METPTVTHPYRNILLSNEKEHSTDILPSMDEPLMYHARLHEARFEVQNYRDRTQVSGHQGLGLWREDVYKMVLCWERGDFGSHETISHLVYSGVTCLYAFVKTHKLLTQKWVNFVMCKLYVYF